MNHSLETKLQRLWLFVSGIALLLPILLYFDAQQTVDFTNTMTIILAVMFALSLPFSLLALPLIGLFKYGLELEPNSIPGAYFYLIMLCLFGYLQWFWLIPKFFNRGKEFKLPTILEG